MLYNRERIDSPGKQQFVERSIATYAFNYLTVDETPGRSEHDQRIRAQWDVSF